MRNWVLVGISTRCIFFNTRVFYHPGGDFYTMVLQNTKKYNKNKKANRRPGKLTWPPLNPPSSLDTRPHQHQCQQHRHTAQRPPARGCGLQGPSQAVAAQAAHEPAGVMQPQPQPQNDQDQQEHQHPHSTPHHARGAT